MRGKALARWMNVTLFTVTLGVSILPSASSAAGDLFGSLMRFFGTPRDERYPMIGRSSEPSSGPMAYASPSDIPNSPLPLGPSYDPGGRATYCVRLCDGRFFPLSGAAASSRATATKMCSAMCPASRTAVFYGSRIDEARAMSGERYADLANAYVYRDKVVAGCTCNGKDAFGLAPIDVARDPTLRPGDVVATAEGLKVFKGSRGDTHKTADFTPVNRTHLSSDLRRKLSSMRIATSP